jgi:flagellar basal body rod protein FlgG
MIDRLKFSMKAMQMISRYQDITANNLANINTPGYKKDQLFFNAFQEQLNGQNVSDPIANQQLNLEPGSLESTGNLFDFAIQGNGFFNINYEGQEMMSRNGRFSLDGDGFMRDENGGFVQGMSGDIFLPQINDLRNESQQVNIDVGKDGTIRINDEIVDKIQLVTVDDPSQIQRRTHSYLQAQPGVDVYDDPDSLVNQGFYESGNVNPLEEMIAMSQNMRLFESQQRAMQSNDEILQKVTTQLGKF